MQVPEDPTELPEHLVGHGVHDLGSIHGHGDDVSVPLHVQALGPFDHTSHDALPISVVLSIDHKPVSGRATHPVTGNYRAR